METVITAYFEEILKMRINDVLAFFKENDIKVVNMKFDYTNSPYKCVIKTEDRK